MQLDRYLDWIANALDSRRDAELEHFWVEYIEPGRQALVEGRLRFWDGSLLKFVEVLQQHGAIIGRLEYAYHYQDHQDTLIFRYDNAPHHPGLATFPHHKHVVTPRQQGESIEPATPLHLADVLREIERLLHPGGV